MGRSGAVGRGSGRFFEVGRVCCVESARVVPKVFQTEDERGGRVFGDWDSVLRGGGAQADATRPHGVCDEGADGARCVEDGAELGEGVEQFGIKDGHAPTGEEDLCLGEGGAVFAPGVAGGDDGAQEEDGGGLCCHRERELRSR